MKLLNKSESEFNTYLNLEITILAVTVCFKIARTWMNHSKLLELTLMDDFIISEKCCDKTHNENACMLLRMKLG